MPCPSIWIKIYDMVSHSRQVLRGTKIFVLCGWGAFLVIARECNDRGDPVSKDVARIRVRLYLHFELCAL